MSCKITVHSLTCTAPWKEMIIYSDGNSTMKELIPTCSKCTCRLAENHFKSLVTESCEITVFVNKLEYLPSNIFHWESNKITTINRNIHVTSRTCQVRKRFDS